MGLHFQLQFFSGKIQRHFKIRTIPDLEDFVADERLLEAAAGFLDVFSGSGNMVEFLLSTWIAMPN